MSCSNDFFPLLLFSYLLYCYLFSVLTIVKLLTELEPFKNIMFTDEILIIVTRITEVAKFVYAAFYVSVVRSFCLFNLVHF